MTRTSPDATPAPVESSPVTEAPAKLRHRDHIEVRESGMHGCGVYTVVIIARGEKAIEYKGGHIMWREALHRHLYGPSDPNHTFYFSLEDGSVIDVKHDDNYARQINHVCKPNCEARETGGHIFVYTLRDIKVGEGLLYDYGLVIEGRQAKALKGRFACRCGVKRCRGTTLAPPEKTKKK